MLDDILVHIPSERASGPVVDASISLGVAFDAHVDAIVTSYIESNTSYAIPAVAAGVETERRRASERSASAIASFETAARGAMLSHECRSIIDLPTLASSAFGDAARVYDLAIVSQPDATLQSSDNLVVTETLLQSGGPVLLVPTAWSGSFMPRRIGICWDGSLHAARALRDARAFVSRADAVFTIAIDEGRAVPAEAAARKLADHIRRAGRVGRPIELAGSRSDVPCIIQSVALHENLDMLVMGAYGHSRMREGLFGSVTREMMKAMPIPILMSH